MTTDKSLARKAVRNPDAFGELFDRYSLKIYRYIYSRVHHRETAEDITSQAFRDAFESIDQYRPIAPFSAWLFTITRRRIADHFRQANPADELPEDLSQGSPEILDGVAQREDLQDLAVQLRTLTEEDREMLRLRFAAQMRYKDIAALLKKSPGAVKMAIYRLLDRLKEKMEKTDGSK
jgi:RNA polymerase sigma-70 factor (ECF subfamily)